MHLYNPLEYTIGVGREEKEILRARKEGKKMMYKVVDRKNRKSIKVMYTAEDMETAKEMLRALVEEQKQNGIYMDTRYAIMVED